jgi:hypothetical protein
MKTTFRNLICRSGAGFKFLQFALCISAVAATGCGGNTSSSSSGSGSTGPINGESTTVAIQLSSTANDEFIHFNMEITKISLTNKAGVTTTIFDTPTAVDFIPVNGNAAPFVTVTIPQDVYTSAAVAVSGPSFSNISMTPQGGIDFNTDAYGYTPTPPVVNLASPITVEGTSMGLVLNLLAAQSGSYTGLQPNQTGYTINPTFDLTPFAIPAEATTPLNGKCIGMAGQVTAVNSAANSMTVAVPGNPATGNPSLTVALNANTVFQGIASASSLTAGTLINMDIALQPDASYAATRVEVPDAAATNVSTGQLAFIDPSYNVVSTTAIQQLGSILSVYPIGMGYEYAYEGAVKYQTSARFPNLSSLPFKANFSSATVAAGQMVSIGSTSISNMGGTWTLPTSVTLAPQTIDAVVNAVSTSGDYTIYTVELAPYDLIAQMNSPAGPAVTTILPNATTVYVYTDSDTSLLNATPLGAGATFRFNGLLFNDSGTLRMVAGQVNDGVAQ